ncbi:hypothetical protein HYH03_000735 [Edaphochlamys debaryana]|uniref:Uncharacterized protein n=1 Tax=Edaphochlamys debaryana TaxID=47281 RepID=A0A835YQX5_9CHLO|nr:hypothetical protein HYH03_000735 [Edaphochlamys debaryana]|eukprot:KAG2502249.1 hypothetical protein HYH03_000735 [Edaphochlamys debaryana]
MARQLAGTRLPLFLVDAFASAPFGGNPAAVCLLGPGQALSDALRQRIAAEMNQTETAFVSVHESSTAAPGSDVFSSASAFRLRWFTPTTEVPCCGHATLASAAVLMEARGNTSPSIAFHTLSGVLTVRRASAAPAPAEPQPASPSLQLALSLPVYDPTDPLPTCAAPAGPLAAACCGPLRVLRAAFCGAGGLCYVLFEVEPGAEGPGAAEAALRSLKPDFGALLGAAPAEEVHGVIVCARTGAAGDSSEPEVVSRFFGPWMGINEDPVTGSAHAVLGPYWEERLRPAGAASGPGAPMRMRQVSPRGGDVLVAVRRGAAGGAEAHVEVAGPAVLVLEGSLRL